MQSQTIGEVERLLRTEMEDLDKFYQEFGEQVDGQQDISRELPSRSSREVGEEFGRDLDVKSQSKNGWNGGLRNSTKFMKSGDFFEYIENIVEEDVNKKRKPSSKIHNLEELDLITEENNIENKNDIESPLRTPNMNICLLYTSPSPRDGLLSRMPSSA